MAGIMSVPILMQSMSCDVRGEGMPIRIYSNTGTNSGMLVAIS